jgi:hypothetical protein
MAVAAQSTEIQTTILDQLSSLIHLLEASSQRKHCASEVVVPLFRTVAQCKICKKESTWETERVQGGKRRGEVGELNAPIISRAVLAVNDRRSPPLC